MYNIFDGTALSSLCGLYKSNTLLLGARSPFADCRPPDVFSSDEGSAKHSGEHYPPLLIFAGLDFTHDGKAVHLFYIFCIKRDTV